MGFFNEMDRETKTRTRNKTIKGKDSENLRKSMDPKNFT